MASAEVGGYEPTRLWVRLLGVWQLAPVWEPDWATEQVMAKDPQAAEWGLEPLSG